MNDIYHDTASKSSLEQQICADFCCKKNWNHTPMLVGLTYGWQANRQNTGGLENYEFFMNKIHS